MNTADLLPYRPHAITSTKNAGLVVPALWAQTPSAGERFVDYFTSHIRNRNTRRAYMNAVGSFTAFCEDLRITRTFARSDRFTRRVE